MKLLKSPKGKALIILYYTLFLAADVFLVFFITLITGSFWAGIGVGLVLSVGIGVLGGELEFREHRKVKYEKYYNEKRAEKPKKVFNFPVKY